MMVKATAEMNTTKKHEQQPKQKLNFRFKHWETLAKNYNQRNLAFCVGHIVSPQTTVKYFQGDALICTYQHKN